jgi:TDG/mug DNA glycosylase family protein
MKSNATKPAPVRSFPPLASTDARLLILGSMPGVASLNAQRYYAHPQNRFWPIMARIFEFAPELAYAERCRQLMICGVAVWDVLQECVRPGSLDSAIDARSVKPNDIGQFLHQHPAVHNIFFNGAAAEQLFRRHILPDLNLPEMPDFTRLPSSSPAHASLDFEQKLTYWRHALERALPR